ncbi:putative serine esterase-domain-containing protein [Haematococcus lacustris]
MGCDVPRAAGHGTHLVVLQHGLWGKADNMAYLADQLAQRAAEEGVDMHILNSAVNEERLTYEGADVCGDRLVAAMEATAAELAEGGRPVRRLSLVGYSLGGVIMRYVAGKLSRRGWFAPARCPAAAEQLPAPGPGPRPTADMSVGGGAASGAGGSGPAGGREGSGADGGSGAREERGGGGEAEQQQPVAEVEAVNWVSVACPHLGCWRLPTSWWARTFNAWVPTVAGRSGAQMMMLDSHAGGRPLLLNLCDPALPFLPALAAFKRRTLLANTYYDRSVPYCTSAICAEDPYALPDTTALAPDPAFPSIVRPAPCPPPRPRMTLALPSFLSKAAAGGGRAAAGQQRPAGAVGSSIAAGRGQGGPRRDKQAMQAAADPAPSDDEGGAGAGAGGGSASAWGGVGQAEGLLAGAAAAASGCALVHEEEGGVGEEGPLLQPGRHPGLAKGWGVRLAVVLLLPLTLPLGLALFGYMVWVGRQQNAAVQGLQLDHSWLGRAPAGGHDPELAEGRRGEGEGAHERAGPPALPPAQPPCRQPAALTPPDYEGAAGLAAGAGLAAAELTQADQQGGEEQQRAAQQQEPRPGDLDVLKPDGVKLHVSSGLVSTPGREQEAQRWMMAQLNSLAWTKVDVDVRHYDSHAAIMMRQPERFKDNADCIRYLVYRCFEM